MTSPKIGADGKPYDPADRVRSALSAIRALVEDIRALGNRGFCFDDGEYAKVSGALNAIADRLATCDALEGVAARRRLSHAELIRAAVDLCRHMRNMGHNWELVQALEDTLTIAGEKP